MRPPAVGVVLLATALGCATLSNRCPPADAVCNRVQVQLNNVRAHLGEPGTLTLENAQREIRAVGEPAVPHLVRALDDDELGVAGFAARVLIETGHTRDLEAWCQGTSPNTEAFCSARTAPRRAAQ